MNTYINNRVILIADYVIKTKNTIRETASVFNISKSTVHKDLQIRLKEIDKNRYVKVKRIMEEHIKNRSFLGGESTRQLFLRKKQLTL